MNPSIFSSLNILYIDHLAVTTPNFEQAFSDYLSLPGSRLIKGPNLNPMQHVKYAFIQLQDGWMIELLAPDAGSPIQAHVDRGGGPYHFCYAVKDLAGAIAQATALGAKVVVQPVPDVAFDGRCVAFLVDPTHGLFELVEAYPQHVQILQEPQIKEGRAIAQVAPPMPLKTGANVSDHQIANNIKQRLILVFQKVFSNLSETDVIQAQMYDFDAWTSLKHLQLVMEVESEFEIDISPHYLSNLIRFSDFLEYLEKHPSGFTG